MVRIKRASSEISKDSYTEDEYCFPKDSNNYNLESAVEQSDRTPRQMTFSLSNSTSSELSNEKCVDSEYHLPTTSSRHELSEQKPMTLTIRTRPRSDSETAIEARKLSLTKQHELDATACVAAKINAKRQALRRLKLDEEIDYSPLPKGYRALQIPLKTDSLRNFEKKLLDLVEIVKGGKSLAVWTGCKLTVHRTRNSLTLAKRRFTQEERVDFEYWRWGQGAHQLPEIDFSKDFEPIPPGPDAARYFLALASAVADIWGFEDAQPEHARWLMKYGGDAIHLIRAVMKVQQAKEALTGGYEWAIDDFAEIQSIHELLHRVENSKWAFEDEICILKERHSAIEAMRANRGTRVLPLAK